MEQLNEKDINHLQWIYDRLINVHNENKNVDYMLAFNRILSKLKEREFAKKDLWTCPDCGNNVFNCKCQ
jgi:hypothetical protein